MADPKDSKLSGAGAYDPYDPQKEALKTLEAFNRAARGRQHTPEKQRRPPQQGRESNMVKKDAPPMKLTPEGPMRDDVDRIVYNENLAKDRDGAAMDRAQRTKELFDSIKSRFERQNQLDLSHENGDKNNDDRGR